MKPKKPERLRQAVLRPKSESLLNIDSRTKAFFDLLAIVGKDDEPVPVVEVLRELTTAPFPQADRRRWPSETWERMVSAIDGLVETSSIPGDLAGLYKDEHRSHTDRVERVGKLTSLWEQEAPDNPLVAGLAEWSWQAAAVLVGDERFKWAQVVGSTSAEGYGKATKTGMLTQLSMVVTDQRLVVSKVFEGAKGGLLGPLTVAFTKISALASIPYDSAEVQHEKSKLGNSGYLIEWASGDALENAIWEKLPTASRNSVRIPIADENGPLLRALAAHFPDLPSDPLMPPGSQRVTCKLCNQDFVVTGPYPAGEFRPASRGNPAASGCTNCGAVYCMNEKRRLGVKLRTGFAGVTCPECGTAEALGNVFSELK